MTQMKVPAVPDTKDRASRKAGFVTVQRPTWVVAMIAAAANRKGLRPIRSLMIPVGMASSPEAIGARPAICPMKSS